MKPPLISYGTYGSNSSKGRNADFVLLNKRVALTIMLEGKRSLDICIQAEWEKNKSACFSKRVVKKYIKLPPHETPEISETMAVTLTCYVGLIPLLDLYPQFTFHDEYDCFHKISSKEDIYTFFKYLSRKKIDENS